MSNAEIIEKWERARIRHSHRHPPVMNINQIQEDADHWPANRHGLARVMGSWTFIIVQSVLLASWIALNVAA